MQSDGSLRLGHHHRAEVASVELASIRRLGYGRYRWVVDTDLSNPSNVFALFVRDMAVSSASHGEQDIEFARWSPTTSTRGGSSPGRRGRKTYSNFPTTNRAPYVVEITGDAATSISSCATPAGRS